MPPPSSPVKANVTMAFRRVASVSERMMAGAPVVLPKASGKVAFRALCGTRFPLQEGALIDSAAPYIGWRGHPSAGYRCDRSKPG